MRTRLLCVIQTCLIGSSFLGCQPRVSPEESNLSEKEERAVKDKILRNSSGYSEEEIRQMSEEAQKKYLDQKGNVSIPENPSTPLPQTLSNLATAGTQLFYTDIDVHEGGVVYIGEFFFRLGYPPNDGRAVSFTKKVSEEDKQEKEREQDVNAIGPEFIFHLGENFKSSLKNDSKSELRFLGCSPRTELWTKKNEILSLSIEKPAGQGGVDSCTDFLKNPDPSEILVGSFFVWIDLNTKEQFQGIAVRKRGWTKGVFNPNAIFVWKEPLRSYGYPIVFNVAWQEETFDMGRGTYPVYTNFFPNFVSGTGKFNENLSGTLQNFFALGGAPRFAEELSRFVWEKLLAEETVKRLWYWGFQVFTVMQINQAIMGFKNLRLSMINATSTAGKGRHIISRWAPVVMNVWDIFMGGVVGVSKISNYVFKELIMKEEPGPMKDTLIVVNRITQNFFTACDQIDGALFIGRLILPRKWVSSIASRIQGEYLLSNNLVSIEKKVKQKISPNNMRKWRKALNAYIQSPEFDNDIMKPLNKYVDDVVNQSNASKNLFQKGKDFVSDLKQRVFGYDEIEKKMRSFSDQDLPASLKKFLEKSPEYKEFATAF